MRPYGGIPLGALAVATLVACGPQGHSAPAGDGQSAALGVDRAGHLSGPTPDTSDDGTLLVATRTAAPSYLGTVHAVVSDADGNVIAGADEDEDVSRAGRAAGELSLALPAGDGYRLRLEARTTDLAPAECHAVIAPLGVEAGASARLQVLSWDCGERMGYVPPSASSDCYWLVDWLTLGRASAQVGDAVPVRMQRSAEAAAPSIAWQVRPASSGHFSESGAAETSFECDEASRVALDLTVTQGDCVERITQPLDCVR